jgi:ACS family tartrate transporter-like MFS transporter
MKRYPHVPGECATPNSNHFPDGTFAAIGIYSALPIFWTLPTAILRGTAAASGIALINSLGNLSGYLGPSMVGYLKDQTGSFQLGLIMLGGFLGMAGLLAFAATRNSFPERSL